MVGLKPLLKLLESLPCQPDIGCGTAYIHKTVTRCLQSSMRAVSLLRILLISSTNTFNSFSACHTMPVIVTAVLSVRPSVCLSVVRHSCETRRNEHTG